MGWFAWVGLLLVVAWGGRALGRGALAPPSLSDPSSWAAWAGVRAPLEVAFAVLALVVVALAWYLLAVTVLGFLARVWGGGRLVSVVDVLTLPVVRRSLHAALGMGLVGTTFAGAGAVAHHRPVPSVAIAASLVAAVEAVEPEGEADAATDAQPTDPPVMRLLPDEEPAGAVEADVAPATPASPTSERTTTEWEARPGDHLWSVAARVLQEAGANGGDEEVAQYWLRLIEANAERLADPANPDLIFPGQVFALPTFPVPADRALP